MMFMVFLVLAFIVFQLIDIWYKNQKVVVGYKEDGTAILQSRGMAAPTDTWWWPWGGSGIYYPTTTTTTGPAKSFWESTFTKPGADYTPGPSGETTLEPYDPNTPAPYRDAPDTWAYHTKAPRYRQPPAGHTMSPWQQQTTTKPWEGTHPPNPDRDWAYGTQPSEYGYNTNYNGY
jgi:hypothetical protein